MSSVLTELPFLIVATGVASVAAVIDARTARIPNWLTMGTLALAPIAHVVFAIARGEGAHGAYTRGMSSLLGVLVAFVPMLLFRKGAMGGGDVKLFAALGALCGFEVGLDIVMHSFFVGAAFAVAVVLYRGKLLNLLKNMGTYFVNLVRPAAKRKPLEDAALHWFRFGPAIFVATGLELASRWKG